jgi:hypothetical protein
MIGIPPTQRSSTIRGYQEMLYTKLQQPSLHLEQLEAKESVGRKWVSSECLFGPRVRRRPSKWEIEAAPKKMRWACLAEFAAADLDVVSFQERHLLSRRGVSYLRPLLPGCLRVTFATETGFLSASADGVSALMVAWIRHLCGLFCLTDGSNRTYYITVYYHSIHTLLYPQ